MSVHDVPPVVLPAPIFRRANGELDHALNRRYAEHVAGTWIEHVVVAGPMGAGESCRSDQRAAVVDVWSRHHPPDHLIVACWEPHEVDRACRRGMRALVMLRAPTDGALLAALAELPNDAIAYANPRYSRALLTAAVMDQASRRRVLPSAVKLSKVPLAELAQIRRTGGDHLQIIHGSSRDITGGSLAAGADLVVSSPLAGLPQPSPAPTLDAVQDAADQLQKKLDEQRDHMTRIAVVANLARDALDVSLVKRDVRSANDGSRSTLTPEW